MFNRIKNTLRLREIRRANRKYQVGVDVNDIGDVRIVTPSCDDPREFLFLQPYGWDYGMVVDKSNAHKLFQSRDVFDVMKLEIDYYEK